MQFLDTQVSIASTPSVRPCDLNMVLKLNNDFYCLLTQFGLRRKLAWFMSFDRNEDLECWKLVNHEMSGSKNSSKAFEKFGPF